MPPSSTCRSYLVNLKACIGDNQYKWYCIVVNLFHEHT
ncbi:Protein of unknown function [Pyronema omphalodes CBS 100304]|uniref:Uncharacterized protein n=1 Tax=Pyronema omphalodes (strain CBS 100304) TaxID=1076935 RepID=U4LU66_PYROM|nr:Protein of unknown function [Pyronema omphalodes CBS 100304]